MWRRLQRAVEKLEAVLVTLGEDDDIFPVIRDALTKARAQAQVRPVSERIQACKSFLERERKRVEVARQTTVKARESLAEAVAAQEKQEALLADGEQRSSQLLLEEKNNLSPFTVPPPPVDASAELSRMQGVINDLQRELARLRPVQPVEPTISDDESMALVPAPHSASVLMSELIEETHAKRLRVAAGSGTGARLQAAAPGCTPGTG